MKLRNIFIAGLSAVAIASCSDYLEVDAPSKNQPGDVFTDARAMEKALYGVYAQLLGDNLFGNKLINTFVRNSDVDFASNSGQYTTSNKYCRYDCDPDGGDLKSTWADLYHGIEVCNLFIENAEASPAYNPAKPDADIIQMIGEAKVVRAILYHELIWNWGDVPFSFNSSQTTTTMIYPITDRIEILKQLIADVQGVADKMKDPAKISEGTERISRQAAYAMVSRMAMTAGGYYLAPEGDTYGKMVRTPDYLDYYQIARDYAKKVKDSDTHHLVKDFYKVFVDECNFLSGTPGDDAIFEIPFGKESTGGIGYFHGPKMEQYEGQTAHPYGKATPGIKLNAFYRFMFDPDDMRRDYINQLFYYKADGGDYKAVVDNSYTVQNGKWSKLWVTGGLGRISESNTGIDYPYLRYTDVLLTLAEAETVLNGGPTALAQECLETVRHRAFDKTNEAKVTDYDTDSDGFLKAVLDERKYEFAGENMRWRDLVRNNQLSVELFYTFYRYYYKAQNEVVLLGYIAERDMDDANGYSNMPDGLYRVETVANSYIKDFPAIGAVKGQPILKEWQFPNQDMKICWIANPYSEEPAPKINEWQANFNTITKSDWGPIDMYVWANDDGVKNEIRYSLLGYIYDDEGAIKIMDNGVATPFSLAPGPGVTVTAEDLPVVRYILPIPRSEVTRSQGAYRNQYGYNN